MLFRSDGGHMEFWFLIFDSFNFDFLFALSVLERRRSLVTILFALSVLEAERRSLVTTFVALILYSASAWRHLRQLNRLMEH